jgi:hypothetical protein
MDKVQKRSSSEGEILGSRISGKFSNTQWYGKVQLNLFFIVYDAQFVIDGNKYNKHIYIFMNIKLFSLIYFLNTILPNDEPIINFRISVGTMHK